MTQSLDSELKRAIELARKGDKAALKSLVITPDWMPEPFRRFIETHMKQYALLNLARIGLYRLRNETNLVEILGKFVQSGTPSEATDWSYQSAETWAELVRQEVSNEFPQLCSIAIVLYWSSLEDLVITVLEYWLANEPDAWQREEVRKIKISLAEYATMDTEDQRLYILSRLRREYASGRGINQFEEMLAVFGLSGEVDRQIRDNIFEMQQVRNALVHRGGIADRKFIKDCPRLGLKEGDPIVVSREMLERYVDAIGDYALELKRRVLRYFLSKFLDSWERIYPSAMLEDAES